jgi:sugar phosphate isomerase/epimerase
MFATSRREFLQQAAASCGAAALVAANAADARANPLDLPIGSQVYPHRTMLKNFPAFCAKMAEIGVTRLELCSPIGYGDEFASLANGAEVKKILDDHGMKSESSHFSMRELRESQDKSIEWAKAVGITQMITATLGGPNRGSNSTLGMVKEAADEYNKIADVAAKAGMQQGLHNEGFEVSFVEGKRVYDLLLDLLDPKLVKFQFQMSTITVGLVAADYFVKYPGRFCSIHLQDIDMKAPVPADAKDRRTGRRGIRRPQAALGKGGIDWVKTFSAAKTGGVKNYFVEQNWELTQQSVEYLKTLKV